MPSNNSQTITSGFLFHNLKLTIMLLSTQITAPIAAGLLLVLLVFVIVIGAILWYDYFRPDRNETNY